MTERTTALECRVEGDAAVLYVTGPWRLKDVPSILRVLRATVLPRSGRYVVDGSRLESIDTAGGFELLKYLADATHAQAAAAFRGFDARYERLLALVQRRMTSDAPGARTARHGVLHDIGLALVTLAQVVGHHMAFAGRVATELAQLVRRPALFRPRETAAQFEATCVNAIPIVVLINFLIGVVVAYVLGVEARRYGADLFVADGVVLAVCRELSPILGSILVAGRSGAAFTAQIGTMKVEEEIDAIATLGLSPLQVLVIPRLVALIFTLPILVLVGDLAGMLGGMLVCSLLLHIPPDAFVARVHSVLELRHLFVGLGKAPIFAVFVAMIASRMGLDVKRDARSVGESTTSTVVQCIVWVIVLDALFAVLFQALDI